MHQNNIRGWLNLAVSILGMAIAVFVAFQSGQAVSVAERSNSIAESAQKVAGEANTYAKEANTLAKEANTYAKEANTLAGNANTLSERALTLAQDANTLAAGANTLAGEANDVALEANQIALLGNDPDINIFNATSRVSTHAFGCQFGGTNPYGYWTYSYFDLNIANTGGRDGTLLGIDVEADGNGYAWKVRAFRDGTEAFLPITIPVNANQRWRLIAERLLVFDSTTKVDQGMRKLENEELTFSWHLSLSGGREFTGSTISTNNDRCCAMAYYEQDCNTRRETVLDIVLR